MNRIIILATFVGLITIVGCSETQEVTEQQNPSQWKFTQKIALEGIAPIGIVAQGNFLWLSDVDHNRILKIDTKGAILEEYAGFERPMHIALYENKLFIPEYTSDTVRILENGHISTYPLAEQPNAISAVATDGSTFAFADFYNNRIILQRGDEVTTIGKEGHNDGELYYPTDVSFHNDLIYVADAYNNRVQVFDKQGKYVNMIGWNEGINVATGLKVTDTQVIVADFEGNRTLVYDHDGKLLQTLTQNFNKPTDIEIIGNTMYVINYAGNDMAVFELVAE